MSILRKRLGELLISLKIVTEKQLEQALALQQQGFQPLGQILIDQGWITEKRLLEVCALQKGVEAWHLDERPPRLDALALVPAHLCRNHQMLPVRVDSDRLILAMRDPGDVDAVDMVRNICRKSVEPVLAQEERLREAIEASYGGAERERVRRLGEQWGVPYVDLSEMQIPDEVIAQVSRDVAQRFKVVPIDVRARRITLAMKNPMDIIAIDEIHLITGQDVEPVIATEEDILNAIAAHYSTEAQVFETLSHVMKDMDASAVMLTDQQAFDDDISIEQLKEFSEEAPVVRLASLILSRGITDKASDIHIEPGKDSVRIRYRVDGILQDGMVLPRKAQASLTSRFKIMAGMDIAERRLAQDGRISATVEGRHFDFRVSMIPNYFGERVVLRILDKSVALRKLPALGFSDHNFALFQNLIRKPYGLILVTGPTGSGKTTTLYAALNQIKQVTNNIMTCEDPVEYAVEGVNQSQVNEKLGLTFAAQLRAILRQDPDVVLVGEIRDQETAETALRAALTGHLVLSTLHTNDAPSAIARLTEMGIEPFLLSTALIGVTAQRLVRLLCVHCREQYPATADERALLELPPADCSLLWRAVGCPQCGSTGYRGRLGIHEIMPVVPEIQRLIAAREPAEAFRRAAALYGYLPMSADVRNRILAGRTSLSEARRLIFFEETDLAPGALVLPQAA